MSLEVTPKVLKITIDGVESEVVSGSMILDAILAQEIDIPHLCKSDSQGPLGACRTCLVEIAGSSRLVAACHTPVTDGMEVSTDSERTNRIRRGVLDLTIGMSADGRGQGQAAVRERPPRPEDGRVHDRPVRGEAPDVREQYPRRAGHLADRRRRRILRVTVFDIVPRLPSL